MVQTFLSIVNELKEFIYVTVALSFIVVLLLQYQCKRYDKFKSHTIVNLFFSISPIKSYMLVAFFLYYAFIISVMIRFKPITLVHIFLFAVLTVIIVGLNIKDKIVIQIIIHHIIEGAAIVVLNILLNYLLYVRMDYIYLAIYIIASLVLFMYLTFVLFIEIRSISMRR